MFAIIFTDETFRILLPCWRGGGLVTSGWVEELRVPSSNPGTGWPLFFGKAAKWPMTTHMPP